MKKTKYFMKDYPRPQYVRQNFQLLDGTWKFSFDDNDIGVKEQWFFNFPGSLEINVPFSYNSKLSGINKIEEHNVIWYQRDTKYDMSLENKSKKNQGKSIDLTLVFVITAYSIHNLLML